MFEFLRRIDACQDRLPIAKRIIFGSIRLEYPHPLSPTIMFWVQQDVVGKGVRLVGGDGRNVVLVSVHDRDDFHRCVLER